MIDCIANSDMTKGPEVPLWECPCRECTHMEWKVVCENSESIYEKPPTLKAWWFVVRASIEVPQAVRQEKRGRGRGPTQTELADQ